VLSYDYYLHYYVSRFLNLVLNSVLRWRVPEKDEFDSDCKTSVRRYDGDEKKSACLGICATKDGI
jgi:hypothetical protein